MREPTQKQQVIAAFTARLEFYLAQNKQLARSISSANDMGLSISAANAVNAAHDLAFIKRRTNWRLALTTYPYTKMYCQDWSLPCRP